MQQPIGDVSIDASTINEGIGRKPSDNWQGMTAVEGEKAAVAMNIVKEYLNEH